MAEWDRLWINAQLATMATGGEAYGAIRDGALASKNGRIAFVGPRAALPDRPEALAAEVIDCSGFWITPGLVDCHTHIVFGGDRAGEFERRLQGASYEEIARAGGGIRSTVTATRAASETKLFDSARRRLARLMAEGVTTVEIKSGYGLTREDELKMLRVARRLGRELPVHVVTTFLGAHAVPPEYAGRQGDYVELVCRDMIPAVAEAGLADAVDAFCERIAFSPEETAAVFAAARAHGLPVKLHADQLSDLGGGRGRHCRRPPAGRLLCPAGKPLAAACRPARGGRSRRPRLRLQSGLVAGALAAPDAQSGLHPLPLDAGGGPRRRDALSGPGAWPRRRPRPPRPRLARRFRPLGHRPSRRARLLARRQSLRWSRQGRHAKACSLITADLGLSRQLVWLMAVQYYAGHGGTGDLGMHAASRTAERAGSGPYPSSRDCAAARGGSGHSSVLMSGRQR